VIQSHEELEVYQMAFDAAMRIFFENCYGPEGTLRQAQGSARGWGDKEQGRVSPCHPLSPSPCLRTGGHRLPPHPPLSPRKQGEGRAGEYLPQRRHPFDDAPFGLAQGRQGRPGDEEGGDLS